MTGSLAFPALAPADVDSIVVLHGSDSVVLVKQSATAWTVNGHRAVAADVTDLLRAFKDTVRPELVAQDASSFARLQVDSATGRWLRVFRGGTPAVQVIAGARGSDYQSTYLRRPGDAHVYLWRGTLAGLAERRADDWRDKRIAALEPDSITALDVERGKDRYTLKRRAVTWTLIVAVALFPSLVDLALSFSGPERAGLGTFFGMAIVFLYFIVYRLYVKLERIEQNLTKAIQELALRDKGIRGQ